MGKTVLYRLGERIPEGGIPVPTIVADFTLSVSGTSIICVDATTTSPGVSVSAWLWQLLNTSAAVVDTKTTQNPTFTSVASGDYKVRLTATSSINIVDARTSTTLTVNASQLATPTLTLGTANGLIVPMTFSAVADETLVEERRLFYTNDGTTPTTASSFTSYLPSEVAVDFSAAVPAVWKFALEDRGVNGLAVDSALSSVQSVTINITGAAPDMPTLNALSIVSAFRIDLSWTNGAVSGQKNVHRVEGGLDFTPDASNLLQGEISSTDTTFTDNSCAPDTDYAYKLVAINTAGEATSNTQLGTTPAQGAWPNNEALMYVDVGSNVSGRTIYGTPYQGQNDKAWDAYWGYSQNWLTALCPDGITPRVAVQTDASAPYSSTHLRLNRQIGDQQGWKALMSRPKLDSAGGGFNILYFRCVFRLSDNWENHSTGDSKIWYWGATYDNKPNVYAPFLRGQGNLTTHLDCDNAGKPNVPNSGSQNLIYRATAPVLFTRGVWNTYELIVKAESVAGADDGMFRVYINDVHISSFNAIGPGKTPGIVNPVDGDQVGWTGPASTSPKFDGIQAFIFKGGNDTSYANSVDDYFDLGEWFVSGIH